MFFKFLILVTFIIGWEVLADFGIINTFLFSSPSRLIKVFFNLLLSGELLKHTGITLIETIIAFFFSSFIGILTGITLWYFDKLRKILDPYIVILNSIPKTAIAPIIIVWFGVGYKAIIVVAISIGVFATTMSYISVLNKLDIEKINLIYVLGGNKKTVLEKVILPYSLPSIISICKINIGLSLIGVIIGEFLVAKNGLGYMIIYGSQIFDLDSVILSLCMLTLISYLFYVLIGFVEKKYTK